MENQCVKCGEQFYVYDGAGFNNLLGPMEMLKQSDLKCVLICHPAAKLLELIETFSKQNGLHFANETDK